MSLVTNLVDLATRISTEVKAVRTLVNGNQADLSSLTTTDKTNLVGAINELDAAIGAGSPTTLDDLTDVVISSPTTGHIVRHNGTNFVNVLGTTHFEVAGAVSALEGTLAPVATSGDAADLTGTLSSAQLPPLAINETFTPVNQAAMLALTAQRGDMAIRQDNGLTYVLSTDSPSTLADWKEVLAAGQVQSVAGKTGVVSLVKGDVGLGNVDNVQQQPLDATLTALAGVSTSADKLIYATGSDAFTTTDLSSFIRTLLDDANASTARGTLSVYSQADIGDPTTNFVTVFEAGLV